MELQLFLLTYSTLVPVATIALVLISLLIYFRWKDITNTTKKVWKWVIR